MRAAMLSFLLFFTIALNAGFALGEDLRFARASLWTGAAPAWVEIADLNGDGRLDIACVKITSAGLLEIFLNQGDRVFSRSTYPCGFTPYGLALADMDRDGDLDAVVPNQSFSVNILRNAGDGSYAEADAYEIGGGGFELATGVVGDFDRDGWADFAGSAAGLVVMRNDRAGGLGPAVRIDEPSEGPLGVADFDADGDLDLISFGRFDDTSRVRLNDGLGGFSGGSLGPVVFSVGGVALGDLNRDGRVDAVATVGGGEDLRVLPGQGDGTLGEAETIRTSGTSEGVGLADLDSDGDLDVVVASFRGFVIDVFLNDGAGDLGPPMSIPAGRGMLDLSFGDLDGDGALDFVASAQEGDEIQVFYNEMNRMEPCGVADIDEPFGVLDLDDVVRFVGLHVLGEEASDLAAPFGVIDLADIVAFLASFGAGCDGEPG